MVATLIDSVRLAKFLHLGYRAHANNEWDKALDALEGVDVKRAGTGTALARGSAAASIPSSATAATLLGESRSTQRNSPGRSPIPGSAAGADWRTF